MSLSLILSQPRHALPTGKGKFSKKNTPYMGAFKKPFDIANGITTFTTFHNVVMKGSYGRYRYSCTPGFKVILLVVSLN